MYMYAAAPLNSLFLLMLYIMDTYGYSLCIPYTFHIHLINMFHIFSLVCFLIYSANRTQILKGCDCGWPSRVPPEPP